VRCSLPVRADRLSVQHIHSGTIGLFYNRRHAYERLQSAVFPMVSVCTVLAIVAPLKLLCYDELGNAHTHNSALRRSFYIVRERAIVDGVRMEFSGHCGLSTLVDVCIAVDCQRNIRGTEKGNYLFLVV
jgi:hypothetical protein